MTTSLNQTPSANRTHIGIFVKRNAGKSSLINAVCGREAVKTGELMEPTTDAVVVENGDVTFIDLPGYGTDGFPEEAFLERFRPFQYDLFLCIFSGKLTEADTEFFPVSSGWAGSAFLCAIRSMGFMLLFGP